MKIKKLDDPAYGRDIFLITDCTIPEVNKYIKRKFGEGECLEDRSVTGYYFGIKEKSQRTAHFVWTDKYKKTSRDIALLAHEILHLTLAILKDVGLNLSDDSEEAYTYFFENLLDQALNKLN